MKFNMKFNMKYCFIALLLIATILFLCLGNNIYEGLINENEVRENTYKSDALYQKKEEKEYLNLLKKQGLLANKNNNNNNNNNLGGDIDKYGCKPSAGEKWCESAGKCVQNYNENCSDDKHNKHNKHNKHDKHDKHDKHNKHRCGDGTKWDDFKKMCVQNNNGEDLCGEGTFFDKIKKLCLPKDDSHQSNVEKNQNELDNNFDYKKNYSNTPSQELSSKNRKSNNNNYMLRTEIVPPVCPACPPVQACPSNKKCPPCPAPEPIQPCPPCARCPEPAFECRKVPNYNSTNKDFLPRPLLNDFSKFT